MTYSKEELAKYRLDKAKEALEEALLLASAGHWNTTASRLYYACFYAVLSYFILKNINAHTHSGVKTIFSKELIYSEQLSKKQGELYIQLFTLRQDADYEDFKDFSQTKIEPLIEQVNEFISSIEKLIVPNT